MDEPLVGPKLLEVEPKASKAETEDSLTTEPSEAEPEGSLETEPIVESKPSFVVIQQSITL